MVRLLVSVNFISVLFRELLSEAIATISRQRRERERERGCVSFREVSPELSPAGNRDSCASQAGRRSFLMRIGRTCARVYPIHVRVLSGLERIQVERRGEKRRRIYVHAYEQVRASTERLSSRGDAALATGP